MAESMVFLHDLQLLEGAIRLRYYIAQFQFCMHVCCFFVCFFLSSSTSA